MALMRKARRLILACLVVALVAMFTPVASAAPKAGKKTSTYVIFDGLGADEGMY